MRSEETALAAVEARARQIWEAREADFPKFTRMRFEDGTRPARDRANCLAFDQLLEEGVIEMTEAGRGFDLTERAAAAI